MFAVPPAGLEPATYRLEGETGRTLCSSPGNQGFSVVRASDSPTVSVSLIRPRLVLKGDWTLRCARSPPQPDITSAPTRGFGAVADHGLQVGDAHPGNRDRAGEVSWTYACRTSTDRSSPGHRQTARADEHVHLAMVPG